MNNKKEREREELHKTIWKIADLGSVKSRFRSFLAFSIL